MGDEKKDYNEIYQKLFFSIVILAFILVVSLVYYFFFHEAACKTEECFKQAFEKCKKASVIKEDDQASWLYQIQKKSSETSRCKVKVTLMVLKQGTIENQKLEGKSMSCNVLKENAFYSEGDLNVCSGELKEGIQDIIIQRMHKYILQNVGQIEGQFKNLK
jgi:dTDP-4-amino-4,6-dideoxygalactose transaminase